MQQNLISECAALDKTYLCSLLCQHAACSRKTSQEEELLKVRTPLNGTAASRSITADVCLSQAGNTLKPQFIQVCRCMWRSGIGSAAVATGATSRMLCGHPDISPLPLNVPPPGKVAHHGLWLQPLPIANNRS